MHRTTVALRRGFTLAEMLAVLALMAALAGLGYFAYRAISGGVSDSSAKDELRAIAAAQQLHYDSRGGFVASGPAGSVTLDQVAEVAANDAGYTDASVDPTTPMQVSVAQSATSSGVPALGLATRSGSGSCVSLVAFPADSGRSRIETVTKAGAFSTCTGSQALSAANVTALP